METEREDFAVNAVSTSDPSITHGTHPDVVHIAIVDESNYASRTSLCGVSVVPLKDQGKLIRSTDSVTCKRCLEIKAANING